MAKQTLTLKKLNSSSFAELVTLCEKHNVQKGDRKAMLDGLKSVMGFETSVKIDFQSLSVTKRDVHGVRTAVKLAAHYHGEDFDQASARILSEDSMKKMNSKRRKKGNVELSKKTLKSILNALAPEFGIKPSSKKS